MTIPENFNPPTPTPHPNHVAHGLAHSGPPSAGSELHQTEDRIENIIKHDPHHQRMGEVYRELDTLRQKDQPHFRENLRAINHKLHQDGLLPDLYIVPDHYIGRDKKDHSGYSLIGNDPNNPGHKVGTEVGTSRPRVQIPAWQRKYYQHLGRPGQRVYNPDTDSPEAGPGAGGGYDTGLEGRLIPEGEHKALIDKALELAGIPVTAANEAALNKIIIRESHWNPNITNTTDSNAAKGDPSKGLCQVIHATFEANRDRSLPDSQVDPLANMVAALNYMGKRYGHGNREAGLQSVAARNSGY